MNLEAAALALAQELGLTAEHPDFPELDWQEAVARGDTREGYWAWVVQEMRYQQHAWLDDEGYH